MAMVITPTARRALLLMLLGLRSRLLYRLWPRLRLWVKLRPWLLHLLRPLLLSRLRVEFGPRLLNLLLRPWLLHRLRVEFRPRLLLGLLRLLRPHRLRLSLRRARLRLLHVLRYLRLSLDRLTRRVCLRVESGP